MTQKSQVEIFAYGRLSYAYLHKGYEGKDDQGRPTLSYCTHLIFNPNDKPEIALPPAVKYGAGLLQAIKDAQQNVALAAWGDQKDNVLIELLNKDKLALHEGNKSKPGQEGYKDNYFVSTNSKVRPTLVESRGGKNVPLVESDGRPYSGCYAVVHMAIYAQGANGRPSKFGKRINCQLMGVQFVKHGDAFGGGRVSTPDEFGVVAGDADASAPAAMAAAGGSSLL